ncbi:glycoside hydrolase family 26 protein [Bailinhaonella thermotolerans]|uniref:Beta-mannanase n=1 Tax=Bailinhaonella thermotolerans TaxID=1070861 RepID=A0A3A4A5Y1_9ACTN|nr:glycosyl hydrolase [Bailinhaonella thermotolerans]RJL23281.1 beta-mannanase [Bailinhaonella thermotolerans]
MRLTLPRLLIVAVIGLLGAYAFVWAPMRTLPADPDLRLNREPSFTWTPPAAAPAARPAFPPYGTAFLGVMTKTGPYDLRPLRDFTRAVGRRPAALQFSQGWETQRFVRGAFDRIARRGMMPIVAWEPWDYAAESMIELEHGGQPKYALKRIIAGEFDDYVTAWARGIKRLRYPVAIRFAHEMNGFWYPWCEGVNGNAPGSYVAAWRHVHDIFTRLGVDNVTWIWSPNVHYQGSTPLKGLYPGDDYVDWVGLSGYYGTEGMEGYRSFSEVFSPTLKTIRQLTRKPVVITEVAATDVSGLKARWVEQMFRQLPKHPDIIGVIWYEAVKETDWRIAASPRAAQAYAEGAAGTGVTTTWSPDMVPRTSLTRPPATRRPATTPSAARPSAAKARNAPPAPGRASPGPG